MSATLSDPRVLALLLRMAQASLDDVVVGKEEFITILGGDPDKVMPQAEVVELLISSLEAGAAILGVLSMVTNVSVEELVLSMSELGES